jgi:hypothetical protein
VSRPKAPPGLPGVVLGALELPPPSSGLTVVEGWTLRACDLSPGEWARRVAAPRGRKGEVLTGLCDFKRKTLWLCVRQTNIGFAQTLIHEAAHAVYPEAAGTKRGEQWSEVSERVAGVLLRSGALRLTLRDRQIDAVRRQILGGPAAEPFEASGRLEPQPGGPWARGLEASSS